jgi:DNA polymerase III epsilon subunit family exonuclease
MAREATATPGRLWVAFDLETTGLDPATDRIVEIGAIRFDEEGREIDVFESLVNPRRPVSPGAFAVHGIGEEELRRAPGIEVVLPAFLDWLGRWPAAGLVAHNARFDASFLGRELARVGREAPVEAVHDTLDLSRRHLTGSRNHRLETLAAQLGLSLEGSHRALADSRRVMALWLHLGGEEGRTSSYPILCGGEEESAPPRGWERLSQAIAMGYQVRMEYTGGTRGEAPREITPVRYHHLGGVAYLIAYCHLGGIEKKFRLDRIASYELIVPALLASLKVGGGGEPPAPGA